MTVNICGALTELLYEHGMSDVIDGMRQLAQKGQVEFTGSAKYHPILPLIPQSERLRQIILNHQMNRQFFGESYLPQGFFPPEMGYSRDIIKPVIDTGHKWLILSGVACPTSWPTDTIHETAVDAQRLNVFFRDDVVSNDISFRKVSAAGFLDRLRQLLGTRKKIYVITAMDAETFGHHIKDWEKLFLEEVYQTVKPVTAIDRGVKRLQRLVDTQRELFVSPKKRDGPEIQVVTISQLLQLFPRGELIEPRASSWSTSQADIQADNPYPLWKSKVNTIHQLQWQHLQIAMSLFHKAVEVATTDSGKYYADIAQWLLDRAQFSDQFWWANQNPMWDVNLINRGLMIQREVIINAYKAIKASNLSEDEKTEYYYQVVGAHNLVSKITDQLFLR